MRSEHAPCMPARGANIKTTTKNVGHPRCSAESSAHVEYVRQSQRSRVDLRSQNHCVGSCHLKDSNVILSFNLPEMQYDNPNKWPFHLELADHLRPAHNAV